MEQNNLTRGPVIPILATVVWLVLAILAAVPVMMFDSGTDNVPVWVWMAFYGMWAFLFTCVLTVPIT